MKYSRMFFFFVLMTAAVASFGAYDGTKPADNEYVADVPALVRENFRAIKDDAIVNAGTVAGLSVGNASGNIPRSNGTLNTNLNADLLDGYHASAFNASDALNLRLDGSRAMTGSLKFSGNYGVLQSTSDGADNQYLSLCGGGGSNADRGPLIGLYGNEYTTIGGQARYYAGNVSTGDHVFYTSTGVERMRLTYSGKLGIGTAAPGEILSVSGTNVKPVIGKNSHTVLYPGFDSQNVTELEIHANGTGTTFSNLVLSNPTTSGYGGGLVFATTGTVGTEKRYSAIIGGLESDSSASTTGMLQFSTSNAGTFSERMRITANGNVLIGTTTNDGTNKLQVNGGAAISGDLTVTGAGTNFRNAIKAVDGSGSGVDADSVDTYHAQISAANGTIPVRDSSNGRINITGSNVNGAAYVVTTGSGNSAVYGINNSSGGIGAEGRSDGASGVGLYGMANGTSGIGVKGFGPSGGYDFYASGSGTDYGTSSSIRWKKNRKPIANALGIVNKLDGLRFTWDKEHGGNPGIGFIAEEVGKYLPEIVVWDAKAPGYADGMDYSKMTPLLLQAIKELNAKVSRRTSDNAALLRKIEKQEREIQNLRDEIKEIRSMMVPKMNFGEMTVIYCDAVKH